MLGLLRDRIVLVYALGVTGAFMQIAGGFWDVSWHVLGMVETFFTPPHAVLYTGIALALVAALVGLGMRFTVFAHDPVRRRLLGGLHIALAGGAFQVVAGPSDLWWHETFGFDPFLFTPSHTLLILGIVLVGVGMASGSARLLEAHRAHVELGRGASPGVLRSFVVVGLATLWMGLNAVVYLLTDADGMAYTFGLGPGFVQEFGTFAFLAAPLALAVTGTLVFFGAKRALGRTGAVTAVALLYAGTMVLANIGFRAAMLGSTESGLLMASFIPVYLAFVAPVLVFDLAVKDSRAGRRTLLGSALIGPFASYLDSWYSAILWVEAREWFLLLIVPTILAGFVAGLLRARFENALLWGRARAGTPTT